MPTGPTRIGKSSDSIAGLLRRAAPAPFFLLTAILGAYLLNAIIPQAHLILLLLATVLSGWFSGRSVGIASGALAFIAALYLFIPPIGQFAVAGELHPTAVLFAVALVATGWLSGEWSKDRNNFRHTGEQYRCLLDGIRDHAVFLLDAEGNVSTWNSGAQRLKGYTEAEILGKPTSLFYRPEDVEKGQPQELLRIAARDGTVSTQGWRVRKDGSQFWAEIVVTALFEGNGKVRGYAKSTRDITELRQNRETLEAKEKELRTVIESTPDSVLMVNQEGTILFSNPRVESMFGYSPRELVGKKIELLVPAAKRSPHVKLREAYQKVPHVRPMGMGMDLSAVRKDGTEFPVEIGLGPVESSSDLRFVASVRDVTERRSLQRELQNRKIQELAQLMIRDLDGRIVQWNAGMTRLYGYSATEAEGAISHHLLDTVFPQQLEGIEAELLRNGLWEGELAHRRKDGERIYVTSSWVLHRDQNGKPLRVLESCQDVTALKKAEENARHLNRELEKQNTDLSLAKAIIESQTQHIAVTAKMSALGEMAGGLAHEINNPMGIIHARASDLAEFAETVESVPSKLVIETMEKVRNTASRVTKITLGLRKFARETRGDSLSLVPVVEIIEDTLSFCTQRLRQNCIELRVAPVDRSLCVACRATEISQVLLNLLNNAVDAILNLQDKWIELSVRPVGGNLEISVTDSGSGIPPHIREKMGQPFFTTKEVGRGTGLGLSISKGIVEAHGGHLDLDATCEHTRLLVTLPTVVTPARVSAAERQASAD